MLLIAPNSSNSCTVLFAILSKTQWDMQEGDDEADSAMVGKFAQVFLFSCNWIIIISYFANLLFPA